MSLNQHPLPWKVIKDRAGDCGIYDASGEWTGIMVAKMDAPEGYDAEQIAQAIVKVFNGETEQEQGDEAYGNLVDLYGFPESALKEKTPTELLYMLRKIEEAGWDGETAMLRAEMFADEMGVELCDETGWNQ